MSVGTGRGFALAVLLFSLSVEVFGQATGRIAGQIVDPAGAAVPNAVVTLGAAGSGAVAFRTTTTEEGIFTFLSLPPGNYDLTVEASGFQKYLGRNIIVDPGRETSVPAIKLEVGSVAETVEVSAVATGVQTTNAEISTTVSNEQVRKLPQLNRSPLALIGTQAGVNSTGRSNTTINGLRPSLTNVTFEGINIQDNFIRSNGLDFQPNLLLLDQVGSITVATSNTNASQGNGAAQVGFVAPSGTNQYHGSVYWTNRNAYFAANTWFNNRDGIARPFLNQNQLGAAVGGPIIRNKLFFYSNYEAFRLRQQSPQNRTILTADARRGIFTYRDTAGAIRQVNILTATGNTIDPVVANLLNQVPGPEKANNFRVGDSTEGFLRNTIGYSFNGRANRTRDNVLGKVDYILNPTNSFVGTFAWNRDIVDRQDLSNNFNVVPNVQNDSATKFLSTAWRWNPTPRITNELRYGMNLAPAPFLTSQEFGEFIPAGFIFSNPINTFRAQGRDTNTYTVLDNANWTRGRHAFQFGGQWQRITTAPFNDAGITPVYTVGIGAGQTGLTGAQLPGIAAADLIAANNMLASLAGLLNSYSQTFNITSRTSGFVAGAPSLRHYILDQWSAYFQDNWKVTSRLTLNMGVRWEYFSPVTERDSLALLPELINNNPYTTLVSNATLNFAGNSVNRPWYNKDWNNFGPNVGFAWDVLGNGKLAVRGGYSINYVNDNTIRSADSLTSGIVNTGLSQTVSAQGLSGRFSAGRPPVPVPAFTVPRTFADNFRLDPQATFGLINPNLKTPYVQQWNLSVQREIFGFVVDARYVGNHLVQGYRAFDFNQVNLQTGGYIDDFRRAQRNGELALAATGVFNPAFNAAIPGSQQLTFFPRLVSGGLLTNATVRNLIQTGQAGGLASFYHQNRLNGDISFWANPNAFETRYLTNYSHTTFNAFQIDISRRLSRDFQFQFNYQFAKSLSDFSGNDQRNLDYFLDQNNPKLEKAPTIFDIRHQFKANGSIDLPFGRGKALLNSSRFLDAIVGGWTISGIFTLQSGTPFSILSARSTFNRGSTQSGNVSGQNTVNTLATLSQINDNLAVRMTGRGPYFGAASILNPNDGRGVAPDGQAPFNGQIFFYPNAGTIGTLGRRIFNGPWVYNIDTGVLKTVKVTEQIGVELRGEAFNLFNHPTWFVGDQDVSSVNFLRITSTFFDRRRLQFGLAVRF
jgi:hypothetical protein